MERNLVRIFAVVVTILAVVGLIAGEGHLLGMMNVDMTLDILRVGLAAVLIYAGFFSDSQQMTKWTLLLFAVLYLGMGALGLFDMKLWGMLPAGLTTFDVVFHLVAGLIAVVAGLRIKDTQRS